MFARTGRLGRPSKTGVPYSVTSTIFGPFGNFSTMTPFRCLVFLCCVSLAVADNPSCLPVKRLYKGKSYPAEDVPSTPVDSKLSYGAGFTLGKFTVNCGLYTMKLHIVYFALARLSCCSAAFDSLTCYLARRTAASLCHQW